MAKHRCSIYSGSCTTTAPAVPKIYSHARVERPNPVDGLIMWPYPSICPWIREFISARTHLLDVATNGLRFNVILAGTSSEGIWSKTLAASARLLSFCTLVNSDVKLAWALITTVCVDGPVSFGDVYTKSVNSGTTIAAQNNITRLGTCIVSFQQWMCPAKMAQEFECATENTSRSISMRYIYLIYYKQKIFYLYNIFARL